MEKDKTIRFFSFTHGYFRSFQATLAFYGLDERWCSAGLIAVAVVTWEQSEGDWIDAVLLGGRGALGVRDVNLELNRLLEDGGAGGGFVLSPKTRLRDDAVTEAGYLRKEDRFTVRYLKAIMRNILETCKSVALI